jgi:LysR family transcriptional activator of mexEF-oprN operon
MHTSYGRDLDLNLLRVFAVVADAGSVTEAASRLYLTQPAVSAALRRLQTAVGAPLFARQGRGLALSARGEQLRQSIQPHLQALVDAALVPAQFDPATSERTFRLGLSDAAEAWLLPPLLRLLGPKMRVISIPVQFRTVAAAFAAGLDAAVSVADELPSSVRREPLYSEGFVAVYDPRHVRIKRLTERAYFAHEHAIVSYNGDLRGIVEDVTRKHRNVRCSVSSFLTLGTLLEGSALIATVPRRVAEHIVRKRPVLRIAPLPFSLDGTAVELMWPATTDDDAPCRYLREQIKLLSAQRTRGPA